ncbi:HAD-IIIC family phosphatase [Teredinibacter turnerae]|uniref:HAD-IIIC family phosphatase n=1 Tax=Teredinibacter turnerae TaxID=2426 RepID=UPI00036C2477|nr:HAD-IIIC family phosphatase [Teredinibacter turnerae]
MENLQRLREIRSLKKNLTDPANAEAIVKHLREIDEVASMAKAGFSLQSVSLDQWNANGRNFVKPIRIGIVSNFMCGEIENYLRFNLTRECICPEFYLGDFDQYIFELMNENSELQQFNPALTVCLLDEHVVTDRLSDEWFIDEMEAKLTEVSASLCELFSRYASRSSGVLVLNTIPLAALTYQAIIDYRSKARLSRAWREFNNQLLNLAAAHKNIVVLDTELFQQNSSVKLRDVRMASYAKMYMDETLLAEIAAEIRKVVQSVVGKTKKCLVLDCDNTLWGGVIGDDGLEGIVLGDSPEGEAYVAFHRSIKRLAKQGVILAINSKNDKVNTDKVFDSHPDSVLRQDDFVTQSVNWDPKHENLKTIAAQINIGTDHLVFVDDSEFECNLVKGMLPEVHVINLAGEASEFVEAVLAGGWFNTLELTSEDFQRASQYKSQVAREDFRAAYDSYEDYLRELEISVELFVPDEIALPRIAQLTQRTNQFNLTTWRLSESEVQAMMADHDWLVLGIRAADRFGDNGIVGAMFIQRSQQFDGSLAFIVKNVLLSCRVFSRGIETSALREVLLLASEEGASKVYGEYIPSAKNGKFEHFFETHGFEAVDKNSNDTITYVHPLRDLPEAVSWIAIKSHTTETENVYA